MKIKVFPFLAALTVGIATFQTGAAAATLVNWDFSGIPAADGSQENAAQPHPLLVASTANAAAGLSSSDMDHLGLLYSTATAPGGVGTSVAGELNIKNFDVGGDGSNDNYIFFTATADVGNTLSIDSIGVSIWRNGGGAPDGMAFDVSIDSGAFQLYDAVFDQNATGAASKSTITFTESITGAGSVEFRFTPRNAGSGSTGNLHIDGMTIEGSVVPVPEPSGSVLALVGLTAMLVRRRR